MAAKWEQLNAPSFSGSNELRKQAGSQIDAAFDKALGGIKSLQDAEAVRTALLKDQYESEIKGHLYQQAGDARNLNTLDKINSLNADILGQEYNMEKDAISQFRKEQIALLNQDIGLINDPIAMGAAIAKLDQSIVDSNPRIAGHLKDLNISPDYGYLRGINGIGTGAGSMPATAPLAPVVDPIVGSASNPTVDATGKPIPSGTEGDKPSRTSIDEIIRGGMGKGYLAEQGAKGSPINTSLIRFGGAQLEGLGDNPTLAQVVEANKDGVKFKSVVDGKEVSDTSTALGDYQILTSMFNDPKNYKRYKVDPKMPWREAQPLIARKILEENLGDKNKQDRSLGGIYQGLAAKDSNGNILSSVPSDALKQVLPGLESLKISDVNAAIKAKYGNDPKAKDKFWKDVEGVIIRSEGGEAAYANYLANQNTPPSGKQVLEDMKASANNPTEIQATFFGADTYTQAEIMDGLLNELGRAHTQVTEGIPAKLNTEQFSGLSKSGVINKLVSENVFGEGVTFKQAARQFDLAVEMFRDAKVPVPDNAVIAAMLAQAVTGTDAGATGLHDGGRLDRIVNWFTGAGGFNEDAMKTLINEYSSGRTSVDKAKAATISRLTDDIKISFDNYLNLQNAIIEGKNRTRNDLLRAGVISSDMPEKEINEIIDSLPNFKTLEGTLALEMATFASLANQALSGYSPKTTTIAQMDANRKANSAASVDKGAVDGIYDSMWGGDPNTGTKGFIPYVGSRVGEWMENDPFFNPLSDKFDKGNPTASPLTHEESLPNVSDAHRMLGNRSSGETRLRHGKPLPPREMLSAVNYLISQGYPEYKIERLINGEARDKQIHRLPKKDFISEMEKLLKNS